MLKTCPGTTDERCKRNTLIDLNQTRCQYCKREQKYLDQIQEHKELEKLRNEPDKGYTKELVKQMIMECK